MRWEFYGAMILLVSMPLYSRALAAEESNTPNSSDAIFKRTTHFSSDEGSSRGVAWGDYDNDGFVDLVVSNTDDQPLFLYHNNKGKSFKRVIEGELGAFRGYSEGVNWVDYNNDGWLDLFVSTTVGPNLLFRNVEGVSFEKIIGDELTSVDINTSMACWEDFNQDGFLDVFLATRGEKPDMLFQNLQGKKFVQVATAFSKVATDARTCAAADFNGDGLPDIYIGAFLRAMADGSERKSPNSLFFNGRDMNFRHVQNGHAVNYPTLTYGAVPVDYDHDGDIDLFQTNIGSVDHNVLYENIENSALYPRFDLPLSIDSYGPSKGATWGDFDLDGDLDLFVAEGTEGLSEEDAPYDVLNKLYLGENDGYLRMSSGALVEDYNISAGAATADFDNDGDLDLFVANWGDGGEINVLYENVSTGNWVRFLPQGVKSNRMGAGVRVTIEYESHGELKNQSRNRFLQTGYASENENELHFGLSSAEKILKACVYWPSGERQCDQNLDINNVYTVDQSGRFSSRD